MSVGWLPHLNATLNATAAVLLALGFRAIRKRRIDVHRRFMVAAFAVSTTFLVSYLIYHAQVGSVHFTGTGWVRGVYFFILITHIILAAAVVPLAGVALGFALSGHFARHRRIARIAWPVWMYVSVTGVIVYLMLYHL